MTRLWDRGGELDAAVTRLTVGRDPELDLRLVGHDALASAAHAEMLHAIDVLSAEDLRGLRTELVKIADDALSGRFEIDPADEDGHTAIEGRLTDRLGDAGRRIHTGRSRNDQVIAAVRLWGRERLLEQYQWTVRLIRGLLELARRHRETSMPGYSHTRQAMPTTFGHWMAAHAETLLDDLLWLRRAYWHLNRSPLGSASGFGVALPLDRQRVAQLLAFDSVQHNTLAVQNDRGKSEWLALGAALAVGQDLGRMASDLIWLSSDELRFVRLPERLTTGSSIMPQKRNPDVLELIRAGSAVLHSRQREIAAVFSTLPSGYHRDLQLTKEPFLEGMRLLVDQLQAMDAVIDGLEIDETRCHDAVLPTTGATDALYARVASGTAFRSAYREVAADPEGAVDDDPAEGWRRREHEGAPGSDLLEASEKRLGELESWWRDRTDQIEKCWDWFREA